MKSWAQLSSIGVITCLLTAPFAEAGLFSFVKQGKPHPKELKVRTTAYTHTESDHLQYGKKTAAGGTLKYTKKYTSAAADWSKFPLGTKFKIDGLKTTFVIDDYGSALVGSETIDIYHPSKSAMNRWGVKHVDITILEYGDFEASREILEGRTKYSHVRKMLAGIKNDPGPEHQGPVPSSKPAPLRLPERQVTPKTPPIPEPAPAPEMELAWSALPPAPPVAPPVAPPAPQPSSSPKESLAPTAEPGPEKSPPLATKAPPVLSSAPPTATAPVPAAPGPPRQRRFAPLSLAGFSDSTPSSPGEDPAPAVVSSPPAPSNPSPAPVTPAFKKREFRPLMASVNR